MRAREHSPPAKARATEIGLTLIYVNQYGGQDELVFDGRSFVVNADGAPVVQRGWGSETHMVELQESENGLHVAPQAPIAAQDEIADIYAAAVLGLRDYVEKNRFPGVLLGLSGGIDSAICAAMAVDDYLYKTFPEKYAAFRANFPRNADGTCDVSGVPGPPPGGPPL